MERDAIRRALVRYGILFLISVVLVAGFWFHSEFYQIGLVPLLIIGGFATFLVLLALRAVSTGTLWRGRAAGTILFPRDAGERVLAGTQTMAVLPVEETVPPPGSRARAVVATTSQPLTDLRIQDVRRRLLGDVREDEAALAGYDGVDGLRTAWSRGRKWDERELVLLVEFRREAKG